MDNAINANLLFKWRRQRRSETALHTLPTTLPLPITVRVTTPTVLLPVHITPDDDAPNVRAHATLRPVATATALSATTATTARSALPGIIELEIAGAQLRLRGAVDETSLCSVLRALRQSA